jgi:hypothetical protein
MLELKNYNSAIFLSALISIRTNLGLSRQYKLELIWLAFNILKRKTRHKKVIQKRLNAYLKVVGIVAVGL